MWKRLTNRISHYLTRNRSNRRMHQIENKIENPLANAKVQYQKPKYPRPASLDKNVEAIIG